ncbi:hypothetical protein YQE_08429, partial [Dendroctonus ponderosae]
MVSAFFGGNTKGFKGFFVFRGRVAAQGGQPPCWNRRPADITSQTHQMDALSKSFPGREPQIAQLLAYFRAAPYPPAVYIRGGPSSGKCAIVSGLLGALRIRHALVDLVECYSSKVLFELVLNQLSGHRVDPAVGAPFAACDHLMDFVGQLGRIEDVDGSVVVLRHAEELRKLEANVLAGFLGLRQLTRVRVSVVLLSEVAFEKYYHKLNLSEPLKVHFPQYSMEQLLHILQLDFPHAEQLSAVQVDREFHRSYLSVFLPVFYRACRDLSELRHMSRKHFAQYCQPVLDQQLRAQDSLALWKRIAPIFNAATSVLYLRVSSKHPGQGLELPFYSKYLLIAAYLASYNSSTDDKRLFMKFHGKKRKTRHDIERKNKPSAHLNTQIGPKAFTLDRLLAIFYSILEDKVGFNNHLLIQVSSLVQLQLLSLASDECSLDERKYKCNVNFETIQTIARMVGFNVRKFLTDFSHM